MMSKDVPLPSLTSRQSLPQAIYAALRQDILNGVYQPGESLRQEALATYFDASRVPVREALGRLEAEGLVSLRPRRGYVVASLDIDDIEEIFHLRMILEEHAGFVATRVRTDKDVAEVEAILKGFERLEHDEPENVAEWAVQNRLFHSRLFASSRQKHALNLVNTLRDMVERYVRIEVSMTGHFDPVDSEHRKIFQAFADGDAPLVAQLSREHCAHTAERLICGLKAGKVPDAAAKVE